MANWGGDRDRDSQYETTREILRLGLKRCSVFGNIYVTRALFCQPVSLQILNCMPAITLLFPLLNTNQIWEQCQSVWRSR